MVGVIVDVMGLMVVFPPHGTCVYHSKPEGDDGCLAGLGGRGRLCWSA